MPRPRPTFDEDDIIRRYRAGESPRVLAESIGASSAFVQKFLKDSGVRRSVKEARNMKRPDPAWLAEGVRLHLDGVPQADIAQRFGISQSTVSQGLISRGHRTDRGRAERGKWQRMSEAERAAQVAAAHAASTGRILPATELARRAATKEVRQSHATAEERLIAAAISARGPACVLQKAVGPYNLDMAIGTTVAVELFGGGWHAYGRHGARLKQRLMDVADAGFNQLIIWTRSRHPMPGKRALVVSAVADDAVAYADQARGNPSLRRQYRVIWGDGEFISAGCVDDNNLTLVPSRV